MCVAASTLLWFSGCSLCSALVTSVASLWWGTCTSTTLLTRSSSWRSHQRTTRSLLEAASAVDSLELATKQPEPHTVTGDGSHWKTLSAIIAWGKQIAAAAALPVCVRHVLSSVCTNKRVMLHLAFPRCFSVAVQRTATWSCGVGAAVGNSESEFAAHVVAIACCCLCTLPILCLLPHTPCDAGESVGAPSFSCVPSLW